jgi:hypothetical protein
VGNLKSKLRRIARIAASSGILIVAGALMTPAHAKSKSLISSNAGGSGPGPMLSTYFDLGYYGYGNDDVVRLTNLAGVPACAYIYVFDTDQELQEACAVGLSPNKELSFSVADGLTKNPAFGNFYNDDVAGIIEIVSGLPNSGTSVFASTSEGITCDPAALFFQITAVNAYLETSVVVESYGDWLPGATVLPFTDDGNADASNVLTMQAALAVLGSEIGASGKGICTTDPWIAPPSNNGAAN